MKSRLIAGEFEFGIYVSGPGRGQQAEWLF
jgi:hypothetical protein